MIIEPYILLYIHNLYLSSQTNLIDFYDFGVMVASLCMGFLADFRGRVPLLKIAIIGQSVMCLFQNAVINQLINVLGTLTWYICVDANDLGNIERNNSLN